MSPGKEKQSKNVTLRVFWRRVSAGRRALLAAVFFSLTATAAGLIPPQLVRFSVDSVFGNAEYPSFLSFLPGRDYLAANLIIISGIIAGAAVVQALSIYFQKFFILKSGEKTARTLRDELFTHIQKLPFSWHTSVQTGDIIQRATSDVNLLKRFMSEQMVELIQTVIMIICGLIIMFFLSPEAAAVDAVFIPVIIIFSVRYFKSIGVKFKETDEAEGRVSAALQENLTGIRTVRAFGRQKSETDNFEKKTGELFDLWRVLSRKMGAFWATGDAIAALQLLAVLVTGVFLAAAGTVTSGTFIAFIFYNQMMIWPVRNFGRILGEGSKAGIALKRLEEVFSAEPEVDGGTLTPEIKGAIEFKNVSFKYASAADKNADGQEKEERANTLNGVSFKIGAGKTLGIFGGTGSGKSTVAALIGRLYDADGGEVLLDGVDVKLMKRAHVRRSAGVILQEPFLFSRTLRENLTIAAPEAADADVAEAAEIADLTETVKEFSKGYDTRVGERGVTLSGGQKQRAAIARTLLAKPPIIVFDDSLSAVDTVTDLKIRAALAERLKGVTTVLISHRAATLMHADLIIVLEDGRVVQSGTHDELMAAGGFYKRVYEMQN